MEAVDKFPGDFWRIKRKGGRGGKDSIEALDEREDIVRRAMNGRTMNGRIT